MKPSPQPASLADAHPTWPSWLMLALLVVILLQSLVGTSPELYWDLDPRSNIAAAPGSAPEQTSEAPADPPITMLGPTALAGLHTLGVALAALALGLHIKLKRRIDMLAFALAAVGMIPAIYHALHHARSLHQSAAWIAAVAMALAIAHLAQDRRAKMLAVAALLAMIVPMGVKCFEYVLFEHPMIVRNFNMQEAEILAARGWEQGSPQHLLYRRRLESPDVTGWYGLSNIFGSVMAALGSLALATCVGLFSKYKKRAILPAALLLICVACVVLSKSKGALLALVVGGALATALAFARQRRGVLRALPMATMAILIGAMLGVMARGAMGPPDSWHGERSMLFRYHYWTATGQALIDEPMRMMTGIGPAGFQDVYVQYKDPVNPEEVISAHNVFVDYIAMLGIGGAAWSVLLLLWLWRSARAMRSADSEEPPLFSDDDAQQESKLNQAQAVTLAAMLIVLQIVWHWQMIDDIAAFVRMGTLVGMIAVLAVTLSPQWLTRFWMQAGLLAASLVLLVQAQVEMTFYQVGPVALVWAMVGLAASGATKDDLENDAKTQRVSRVDWIAPGVLAVLMVAMLTGYVPVISSQQRALAQAAQALRRNEPGETMAQLERAIEILPTDPYPYRDKVRLLGEAAQYFEYHGDTHRAQQIWQEALDTLDQASARFTHDTSLLRMSAEYYRSAAEAGANGAQEVAMDRWKQLTAQRGASLTDHLRFADWLWSLGQRDQAREHYQRVLTLHEQAYLDPAKQLTAKQLQQVTQRISQTD